MKPIEYFKLQSKNLFKDYKTQYPVFDESLDLTIYNYTPTYFDIDQIFLDFDCDEENFSLMKAQHLFSKLLGYNNWSDLINASEAELELAKLIWDNQHKINLEDWKTYLFHTKSMNNNTFDDETKLEVFKKVFVEVEGHHTPFQDYRLARQ